MDIDKASLMKTALFARGKAYAPYSGFKVGAALLCADGKIYTGCNVENASYPCGICAERTAAAKAVSEGSPDFIAIAIAGSSGEKCAPCGICRQFLYELDPDLYVLCSDDKGNYDEHRLSELLPCGFGRASLNQ